MKKYKNGQIITIKSKKYRVLHGYCYDCAFWKEHLKALRNRITTWDRMTTWACRVYCEKEHLAYNQIFKEL